jgi:hypothetical protein
MKPRFTTKDEIIALIDKYKAEHAKMCVRVHDLEFLSSRLLGTCEQHRVSSIREQADKIRAQISWRETRLGNLGEKLAEFQTPQLPGVDNGDVSIPRS